MNQDKKPTSLLPPSASMGDGGRRSWLLGGVGLAAALAGGLWSLSRSAASASRNSETQALWALTLNSPSGAPMPLAAYQGRPLLLNFWATWCPPCVDELPRLAAFYRQNAGNGWQVLGLAVDQPSHVLRFLEKTPLPYPVAMAGLEGTDLSKSLGNEAGSLPFSILIHSDGRVLKRKIGQLSSEDLAHWVS